jgi:hypothetical protein
METSVALLGSFAGIPQMEHRRRRTTRTIRNLICSVWGVALMNRVRSPRGVKKAPGEGRNGKLRNTTRGWNRCSNVLVVSAAREFEI